MQIEFSTGMRSPGKLIILLVVLFVVSGLFWSIAHAATSQGSIDVRMVVPAPSGSGGSPPPSTDNPPSISGVGATTTANTAQIIWSASDDKGISAVSFTHGTSTDYGTVGTVVGSYNVSLGGLTASATYYFKIRVVDTGAHAAEYVGTFMTLSAAAPAPSDTAPPAISGISASVGMTTATISWTTDEDADSQVRYGLTSSYGSGATDGGRVTWHSILLFDLLPNTLYHYQIISTDFSAARNSASALDAVFTTSRDFVPPPDAGSFRLSTTTASIKLTWVNPSFLSVPDFSGVKLVRKLGSASVAVSDGIIIYTGSGLAFTDTSATAGLLYYYTLFSFDTSGNYSGGTAVNGRISYPPLSEDCGLAGDEDRDGKADCLDESCRDVPACAPVAAENCGNGADDDRDDAADCADSDCAGDSRCRTSATSTPEICNNSGDDDGDSRVDCADTDCSGFIGCGREPITRVTAEVCGNGIDDNEDNRVDCDDADCAGFSGCAISATTQPSVAPGSVAASIAASTVPESNRITSADLIFTVGGNRIALTSVSGAISSLAGMPLTISIREMALISLPREIVAVVDGAERHMLARDAVNRVYSAQITMPRAGMHFLDVGIDYGNGQTDGLRAGLESLAWGDLTGEKGLRLGNSQITLFHEDGNRWEAETYGQRNPFWTTENGNYGWVVPNGEYYLVISAEGYYDRATPVLLVNNNVVNSSWSLVKRPPSLAEIINPEAPVLENIKNIAKNVAQKTKASAERAVQEMQVIADNPKVEKATEQVVAPAAIGVVAAGAIPLISWANLLPLLRLLFLQPLLLLGQRKREGWGQIYNTLNKLPVDLAIVRLFDGDNGQVLRSRVTDDKGRYAFTVDPGKYRLEVVKSGMVFPSQLLAGYASDGRKTDIYHGEEILATEKDAVITANIPVDPPGEHKTPARLRLERVGRSIQVVLSWFGITISIISFYITPRWHVGALIGAHLTLYLLFRRLALPKRVKSWGLVLDAGDKLPVSQAVVRLFNSQFNKLASMQVTDRRGRYYFLAADGKYYVTYDHKQYIPNKTDMIDLTGKDADTIAVDMQLQKQ